MGYEYSAKTAKVSVPEITMISAIQHTPLFKNRNFLYQKYVVERLSTDEIAAQIPSVRSTVLKHLKLFEIQVRESGTNIRRWNQSYGKVISRRHEITCKAEEKILGRMRELRKTGLSYWKIADVFNAMQIPTKTRRGRWRARTIQRILENVRLEGDSSAQASARQATTSF